MKAIITKPLAIIVTSFILFSITAPSASATSPMTRAFHADTGMITLGPNEFLRLTVTPAAGRRPTSVTVTFQAVVTFATCTNGVCVHTATSQPPTSPVTLNPGQAASYDLTRPPGASAVRMFALLDRSDAVVNAFIINSVTGDTVSHGGIQVALGDGSVRN